MPTAVSDGRLASGGNLVSDQVKVFVACTAGDSGKHNFELRFLVSPFPEYEPAAQIVPTKVTIDGDGHPAKTETFLLEGQPFFIAEPDASNVRKIASVGENRSATLAFDFVLSRRKMTFITTLGHPNAPVAAVLTACGVTIDATPSPIKPAATTAASDVTYSVDGVNLGMTESQVLSALQKIGGPAHFSTSQGGYKAAKTPSISFDSFQFNDAGQVSSMHVKAPNPKRLKETKSSGPTYELALTLFGPPEKQTNNGAFWGREDSGKPFVEYEVGDPGDPSDLWVCDGRIAQ